MKTRTRTRVVGRPVVGSSRVQTTLRLEPDMHQKLQALQSTLGTTLNKLVNMAVAEFVASKAAQIESDLGTAPKRMRALRRADPTFAKT